MKIAVIGCGAYLAHDIEKVLKNVVLYQRLESLNIKKINNQGKI